MKNIYFLLIPFVLLFSSCGNNGRSETRDHEIIDIKEISQSEVDNTTSEVDQEKRVIFFCLENNNFLIELSTELKNIDSDEMVYGNVLFQVFDNNGNQFSSELFMTTTYAPYFINDRFFTTVFYDNENNTRQILVYDDSIKKIELYSSEVHFIRAIAIVENSLFFTTENYDSNVRKIDLTSGVIQELNCGEECSSGLLYLFNDELYVSYGFEVNQYLLISDDISKRLLISDIPEGSQLDSSIHKNFKLVD